MEGLLPRITNMISDDADSVITGTLKNGVVLRDTFRLFSRSLDDLARMIGVDPKMQYDHERVGFSDIFYDPDFYKKTRDYAERDVEILFKVVSYFYQ